MVNKTGIFIYQLNNKLIKMLSKNHLQKILVSSTLNEFQRYPIIVVGINL